MENIVNYMPIEIDDNKNEWHFIMPDSSYSPIVNQGDVIYINKKEKELQDGLTYLFFSQDRNDEFLIRKVSYSISGQLRLTSNDISDLVNEEEFIKKYYTVGRVTQAVTLTKKVF